MTRVVILTGRLDTSPLLFMNRMKDRAIEVAGVVLDMGVIVNRSRYISSRMLKALRIGVLGPLVYRRRFLPVTTGLSMGDAKSVLGQVGCPVVRVPSINSAAAQEVTKGWTFDVALSLGNRYITPNTQQAIGKPIINVHHGKVPEFRGGPPIFWEVHAGLDTVGYTIHLIDAGIDTGPIVGEGSVPIQYGSTLRKTLKATWLELMPRSIEHLLQIAADMDSALLGLMPQPREARSHRTTPSLRHILQAEWRVRRRRSGT